MTRSGNRARARRKDPSTSHVAAAKIGDLTANQEGVMFVMRLLGRPLLDEELVIEYEKRQTAFKLPKQSESGIRSRRAELAKMTPPRLVEYDKRRMKTGGIGRTWGTPPPVGDP